MYGIFGKFVGGNLMIVAIVGSRELWVHNLGKYLPEGVTVLFFLMSKLGQGGLAKLPCHLAFKNYFFFLKYATHHFR